MRRRTTLFLAAPVVLASIPCMAGGLPRRSTGWTGLSSRRLQLRHVATGARFAGIYHDGRAPDPKAMGELSEVLADSRTGAIRRFDAAVLDILWEIGERERLADFTILSGYRTPVTNAAVGGAGDSQHMQAKALDVQVAAARLDAFGKTALGLGRGGVGIYAQQGFIHIDSGPVRRWGDGQGGPAPRRANDPLSRMAEAWAATRRR
jgi:uncharacterized protein YcbK (DUF882 family)